MFARKSVNKYLQPPDARQLAGECCHVATCTIVVGSNAIHAKSIPSCVTASRCYSSVHSLLFVAADWCHGYLRRRTTTGSSSRSTRAQLEMQKYLLSLSLLKRLVRVVGDDKTTKTQDLGLDDYLHRTNRMSHPRRGSIYCFDAIRNDSSHQKHAMGNIELGNTLFYFHRCLHFVSRI